MHGRRRRRRDRSTGRVAPVLLAHPGAELYGSDRMLLESVDALMSVGHPVTVVLPTDGPLVDELTRRGAAVRTCHMPVVRKSVLRPIGFLHFLSDTLTGLWPAVRLLRSPAASVVYVNTLTVPSWLLLARLLGCSVICHVHEAERLAPRPIRWLLTVPARCAQRIVVNSQYSLDVLLDSQPRLGRRSTVVYNSVPGPARRQPARTDLAGPLRVLYVGRLSPRKGPDVALAAVRQAVHDGLDVHLDVLGSTFTGYEWFAAELERAAREPELAGRVTFLGFEPEVWPRLASADVVVVPSVVDEPFGNTAVEAVLAGRPVIVSATSGLLEAASGYESAILVDPGDPAALAGALTRIARDWRTYAAHADTDAMRAADRHGSGRYRAGILDAVARAQAGGTA